MKTSLIIAASLVTLTTASIAFANAEQKHPKHVEWEFDGVLGTLDKQSAQRGFQVYKEVCSACHSLHHVAYRSLAGIGFSPAEIKALAASYQITDGPNDAGEMFQRPAEPSDLFVPPFANEKAAGAGFNGKAPPDLSLMVKARHNGANYIYSLLTGYGETAPEDVHLSEGQHYNPYFPGGNLLMPPPLSEGQVTYEDGTKASVDQMAHDVVTFLQWAAEPEMEQRKQSGIKVILFLAIFTGFMYIAKRNLWRKLH